MLVGRLDQHIRAARFGQLKLRHGQRGIATDRCAGYRMMMALTLGALYASPDHYLHSFDGDQAVFVPMDRAAYHRSIFLDGRIAPAADGELRVPLAALGPAPAPLPTAW